MPPKEILNTTRLRMLLGSNRITDNVCFQFIILLRAVNLHSLFDAGKLKPLCSNDFKKKEAAFSQARLFPSN